MLSVYLNEETVSSIEDVYLRLQNGFHFPDYFGSNLDALFDCLTESTEEREIVISGGKYLEETLGRKYKRFLRVIRDAAAETPSLHLRFTDDDNLSE